MYRERDIWLIFSVSLGGIEMKYKNTKKCTAIIMAAMLAVSGESSVPASRAMEQDVELTEETQDTTNGQEQIKKPTVREVMFPYIYTATGSVVQSDNLGANNYWTRADTVKSYLQKLENGNLQRVEAIGDQVVIEEYNSDYQLVSQRKIPYELSIFGGYFFGNEYRFLVFGQENDAEEDDREIMRVVKYDKEWNRLAETSVCGANTTLPFRAGSLRMTEENGNLFIHTCHQMYTSGDGRRHQANMTYVLAEDRMEFDQSWYGVMNIGYGYVSHSFNQFLIVEDGKLYRMDHGDAYPRSIVISKCNQSAITNCSFESVWSIQGETGDNTTKVSVGGFEKVGKNLVVAGNSCTQESEEAWNADNKRNIFLTITNADTLGTEGNEFESEEESRGNTKKTIWLTNYSGSDVVSVKTPYLVKASDELLYVMWEEENKETKTTTVKIVGVDPQGNIVTDMASIYGRLSDCKPIYESDGTIQWYTSSDAEADCGYEWDDEGNFSYIEKAEETEVNFYQVDTSRLGDYQFKEKMDFSEVEVFLEQTDFVYQAEKEHTPAVTVLYKGSYLEEGRDYKISYTNNKKPGQAHITLTGKGYFQGKKELNFTIKPCDISRYTLVATPASIVYDGSYHCPNCFIFDGEKEIKIDGEYQNQFQYVTGVYTVTFSAIENRGYSGTLTATYEITPKDFEQTKVELGSSNFIYTGQEIKAGVIVTDNGRWLLQDRDYTLSYENNREPGTAQVIITGIGNYKGTVTKTYTIQGNGNATTSAPTGQSTFAPNQESDGMTEVPIVRPTFAPNQEPDGTIAVPIVRPTIAPNLSPVDTETVVPTARPSATPRVTNKPSFISSATNRPTSSRTPATAKPVSYNSSEEIDLRNSSSTTVEEEEENEGIDNYQYLKKVKISGVKKLNNKKYKIMWKKLKGVDGYQIKYWNSKQKKSTTKTVSFGTNTFTLPVSSKKTYYVQVRAYIQDEDGKKIWGVYSKKYKVKVK